MVKVIFGCPNVEKDEKEGVEADVDAVMASSITEEGSRSGE